MSESDAMSDRSPGSMPEFMTRLSDAWGLVLAYGLLTLGLGIALAVWPGETLKVCAVLIAIQLLASGVLRFIAALAGKAEGGLRVLMGLSGALAFIVGLIVLRHPLQTLLAIGLILGAWWVLSGVVDIVGAFLSPVPGRRMWDILSGLVSIVAGGFLLVDPSLSLGVLVLVLSVWLIVTGALTTVAALRLRGLGHARPAGSGSPAPSAA
jgi:uncharacterized membrane protein HdeD (DUF308 family)